jgi:basic amino acid/polyamine antiporter, APA family
LRYNGSAIVSNHRTLARTLKTTEYFTLAFGTMVGVGWLILIDDWLTRGGPAGAMLGYLLGGIFLLPVAYVYGKFVRAIPDSGAEVAYVTSVFPRSIGFIAGWLMTLAYLIVCPWEAVAVGKLVTYIVPATSSLPIYSVAGKTVYLPSLLLGFGLTILILFINYRGIRISSRFQNYSTFALLLSFGLFTVLGASKVSFANYQPVFSNASSLVSILLVLQIVPYFLTGFESVPKCVEEAHATLDPKGFVKAIFLALAAGVLFYVLIIFVVSGLVPWKSIATERYGTAVAFQRAFNSNWIARFILVAALFSLIKVFNGNFISASRLVFALGRGRWVAGNFGKIHDRFQTPYIAVVFCGLVTFVGTLLGDAILIPITEVGSLCSILGWLMTCVAYLKWRKEINPGERLIAISGTTIASLLLILKVFPTAPGSLGRWEYLALGCWMGLGLLLRKKNLPVTNSL